MTELQGDLFSELQKKYDITTLGGQDSLLKDLKKRMIETALEGELGYELGYKKHSREGKKENYRNGYTTKQVLTGEGNIEISVPRDRNGEFEPEILPKRSNDISDWEQRIINMYGLGLSTSDISTHMEEIYGVGISSSKISYVTNKILGDIEDWKHRPLQDIYVIVYLDCIHYKVRQDGKIISKACYVILGIDRDGNKDVLSLVIGENEGARFWLSVVNNLKQRGVQDILIACIDGLKGFPEAIRTVYTKIEIQLCVIHQIRNSTKFVSWKHLKEFTQDLKTVYRAENEQQGLKNLEIMEEKWGKLYGYAFRSWKDNWAELSTMFAYPEELRKIIYTTNAIEGFNRGLRKYTKTKVIFPTDQALEKSLYLAMKNITKKWVGKQRNWGLILSQFQIYFEGRI